MPGGKLAGSGSFARGIHPKDRKSGSAGAPVEVLPAPREVVIPLWQHTGAPCEMTVKPKAPVAMGDVVGDVQAFVAAPVHASVDGTVGPQTVVTLPNGRRVQAVTIAAGEQKLAGRALWEDVYGGAWPTTGLAAHAPEKIVDAVRQAGLVGLGGAAFPTHVKLTRNPAKPIDTLLVNGCECEPYLTADYRLMLEAPLPILVGAVLAAKACGARRIAVVVEDNKPEAIRRLRESGGRIVEGPSAGSAPGIEIVCVRTKYPMGGERQLIPAVLGRDVPTGGLPLDVGVIVVNVGTAAAIARAVLRGRALTHRLVSVGGEGVRSPKNLLTPIGATYADLIEYCGGLTQDAARIIAGGPMMGFALSDLSTPVTKGTSGVTVLTASQVKRAEETACIRCGRCVDVCPLRLVPTKLALASRKQDWETARRYYLAACCECGCCAYICPAQIPLAQLIRTGKALMPKG